MNDKWRISELQMAVTVALESIEYDGQTSARVREVPNTRTIRYYTTLGIMDRASEMKGRTAYYDKRHVLQLVAIKQLQSEGKSLVEIQDELTGATNRKLGGLAKLPSRFWDSLNARLSEVKASEVKTREAKKPKQTTGEPIAPPVSAPTPERDSDAFWKCSPNVSSVLRADSQPTFQIRETTQLEFPGGVTISIPSDQVTPELIEQIKPTVAKLLLQINQGDRTEHHDQSNSSQDNT